MFGCRHDYSWVGLSLAIRGCTDVVIKIVENRQEELPRKAKRLRSKQEPPIKEQMLLFPVDKESRERLAEMIEAVEYALMKNNYNGSFRLPKADYARYEMIGWVRQWPDEEWEPQLAKMKKIADGEIPEVEECLTLIEFLDMAERDATNKWLYENRGGGCF